VAKHRLLAAAAISVASMTLYGGVAYADGPASTNPFSTTIQTTTPGAGGASRSTGDSTVTTVPPVTTRPPADSAPNANYAAVAYAKEKGVSIADAGQRLNQLGELTAYANDRRKSADFAGFRIVDTPGGPEGQLAATSVTTSSFDQTRNIRLFPSRISERDARNLAPALAATAQVSGVGDAVAATIDPFSDNVTIWRKPTTEPANAAPQADVNASGLRDALHQVEPQISTTTNITVQVEPGDALAHGGQKETRSNAFFFYHYTISECTSGFGVGYSDARGFHPGYFTAGHCAGDNDWTVAGNGVRTYWDRLRSAYTDRVIMEANGASYFTYNGVYDEDMASYPTHIYPGSFYCSYSRGMYGQRCGTITEVNVPITDSGITTYTTRGSASQQCVPGDSGGPVWQPRGPGVESIPAGLVEGQAYTNDQCLYTALDDDLYNTGFRLL